MRDFCIIGSGIPGFTITHTLSKKNLLDVYDKARSGGRRQKPPYFY
jgi:protoporphyrinogen oxidase